MDLIKEVIDCINAGRYAVEIEEETKEISGVYLDNKEYITTLLEEDKPIEITASNETDIATLEYSAIVDGEGEYNYYFTYNRLNKFVKIIVSLVD